VLSDHLAAVPGTSYYRNEIQRVESGYHAACFTVGVARYVLDPDVPYPDSERLTRLATAVDELAAALGLTPTRTRTPGSTEGEPR
jgi:hypothetical protein